jgi:hypothetical protein
VFSISIVGNFIFFYFFPFCNGNHLSSWDDTFEISPPLFSWTTNTKHVGLLFVYTRNGTIFVCKHYFVRFYWKVNCKNGDRKLLLFSNSDGIYISWIIFLVKRRRDQWGASLWSDDKETRPSVSLWKEETFFKFLLFHIFIFTLRSLSLSPELVDSFSIVSFFFLSLSTQSWQTNLIVHRDWTISNELIFGFITRRIIIIDTFMLLYIAPGEYLNTVVETTPVSQLPGIVIQKQTAHNHRKNIISCFLNFLVWAETFWASNYWTSYFSSICIYTLRTRTIRQCYRVYGGELSWPVCPVIWHNEKFFFIAFCFVLRFLFFRRKKCRRKLNVLHMQDRLLVFF